VGNVLISLTFGTRASRNITTYAVLDILTGGGGHAIFDMRHSLHPAFRHFLMIASYC
jgi:hypothetical protein